MSTINQQVHERFSYIVFLDEAGFMLGPLVRRTWAPRGHTPVIRIADTHSRISVIGALIIRREPRQFRFKFQLSPDDTNFRGNSVVPFLDAMYHKLHAPITLLWDGIPIHSAKPVVDYLATHRTIDVEPLPPFAPELNPVDQIWSYVKYGRLANYCPHTLFELRKRVRAEFFKLQKKPDLLEALFRHTGLTLDP
jgi:transposase